MKLCKNKFVFWQRLSFLLLAGFSLPNSLHATNLISMRCHHYFVQSDFSSGLTEQESYSLDLLAHKYAKTQVSGDLKDSAQADVKILIQQALLDFSKSLHARGFFHDFLTLKRIFIERTKDALKSGEISVIAQDAMERMHLLQQATTHNQFLMRKTKNILEFYGVHTKEEALVTLVETNRGPLVTNIDLEWIEHLLSMGADVNIRGKEWAMSLLTIAVQNQHESLVRLLLKWKADVEPVGELAEFRPLERVSTAEMVQILLQAGARLDAVSADGLTALMKIISKLKESSVYRSGQAILLIEAGANIHTKSPEGNTALMLACKSGYISVVRLLLQKGAKLNEKNEEGETPLMIATRAEEYDVVQLLLDFNADVSLKNLEGKTALDIAMWGAKTQVRGSLINRSQAIVELLRPHMPNAFSHWISQKKRALKNFFNSRQ